MNLGLSLSLGAAARGEVGPPAPETIGGIEVGSAGAPGTIFEGYTLSAGDDFNSALDIIGPATPRAKYSTTRGAYVIPGTGQFARGSPGLSGYNADPLHTGFNDSNRGAPVSVWADSIVQTGSELTLKTRQRTVADEPHMRDPAKQAIGAMVHTGFALLGRAPIIFEWREKRDSTGWSHSTGWLMQANSYFTFNDFEVDVEAASFSNGAGDGRDIQYNINTWTNGTVNNSPGSVEAAPSNTYIVFAIVIDELGDARIYRDGVLKRTFTGSRAAALARAFYMLWTAHSYEAATVTSTPATFTIDWLRVWRKGGQHYRPLVAGSTYQVNFAGSGSWVLPDQTTVWGGAVTEVVEAGQQEANEPGGTLEGVVYDPLPVGVTYNAGTRTLAVTSSVTKPGRLHIMRYVNQTGSTCEPQRIILEVGPDLSAVVDQAYPPATVVDLDIYALCDVGILVPKTVTVTGLAGTGLSYSSGTGRISGTIAPGANASVTVECTNSVGQVASKVIAVAESASTDFVVDNFNGTATTLITGRSGATGATWTHHPVTVATSGISDRISDSETVYKFLSATNLYFTSGTPPNADYYVEMVLDFKSLPTADAQVGVTGRTNTTAATFYLARYNRAANAIQLFRSVTGTLTQLGSNFAVTWATGEQHTVRLTMVGSTISVQVDGTTRISVTDTNITAAGRAGLRSFAGASDVGTFTTGVHVTSFRANG